MKAEEMNIAIAEHLGWTGCWTKPMPEKHWQCSDEQETTRHGTPPKAGSCTFPNYSGDLNACHEMEMWLKADDPHAYGCYVTDLIEWHGSDAVSARAAQRAKMFLEIIGKWKEAE